MASGRNLMLAVLGVCLGWVPLSAQAPTGTVTGRVVEAESQQPLPGAAVMIGDRGMLTDVSGRFTLLQIPAGARTVRVTLIGYAETTRPVNVTAGGTVNVDIAVAAQALQLAELVVVGYGTQKAGNISGAVKQVRAEEFNTGRIVSPEQLIQSKVAGVQVVDNNEPGGGLSVRIRGATSVNAGNEPLFVIDGVPVGAGSGGGVNTNRNPLNFLNPEDVETITVLKDAAAAAIYGANAANGVVLITTKKGTGRPQIEYTGSVSASQITRTPDMLNAAQFRAAVTQYGPANLPQLGSASTNWFDQISRDAMGQEHNLAVSGSGESMNYRASFGFMEQDGVILGTETRRISLGLNYDQRLLDDHLNVRASMKGARTDDKFTPGGVLSNAAQMGPTQPILDPARPTGYYEWPGRNNDFKDLTSADNPVAWLNLATDKGNTFRSIGSLQGEYRLPFFEALRANVNLNYDVTKADRERFSPIALHDQLKRSLGGTLSRETATQVNTGLDAFLNYTAALGSGPGELDVVGGYSYSQSDGDYPFVVARKLSTDLLGDKGLLGAGEVTNLANIQESRLISFFGRMNFNLNDRYLLSASIRRDGSSRFGDANAWGTFPSVSLGWRLSQEAFLRSIPGLTDLKLRGSWGKTGNQAFANYQQYTTYTIGDAFSQAQFGNEFVTTIRPSASDPKVKWEETNSYDIGLDYGILNGRVTGAVDVYRKKTTDLLFEVPVAAGTSLADRLVTNIGSMQNQGIEFSLSAQVLKSASSSGLSWTADFNAAHNENELLEINPFATNTVTQILVGDISGGVGTRIQVLTAGSPINSFFMYQQKYGSDGKPLEGEYEDLNDDGTINVDDRRTIHEPAPTWILGHSSYLTYGKFDLGFTLRAYLGNYVYNNVASQLGTYAEVTRGAPANLHASVLETGFEQPQYLSDHYLEDASFLRMDNITLGYSLNLRGQPMRVFATAQSAFTLTGYSGVDPTAGLNGIDNNIYPRSRTFSAGLSMQF